MSYLMTPATICLALSFCEQLMKLKKHVPVICVGVILGIVSSMGSILALAKLFGLEHQLLVSLLPKASPPPSAWRSARKQAVFPP